MLLFLLEHAPLEHWQQDVLAIIREEAYYFAPQGHDQDHERGLGHLLALDDHDREGRSTTPRSSTTPTTTPACSAAGRPLNPYKLGVELFRDIEERWNTGRFGKE